MIPRSWTSAPGCKIEGPSEAANRWPKGTTASSDIAPWIEGNRQSKLQRQAFNSLGTKEPLDALSIDPSWKLGWNRGAVFDERSNSLPSRPAVFAVRPALISLSDEEAHSPVEKQVALAGRLKSNWPQTAGMDSVGEEHADKLNTGDRIQLTQSTPADFRALTERLNAGRQALTHTTESEPGHFPSDDKRIGCFPATPSITLTSSSSRSEAIDRLASAALRSYEAIFAESSAPKSEREDSAAAKEEEVHIPPPLLEMFHDSDLSDTASRRSSEDPLRCRTFRLSEAMELMDTASMTNASSTTDLIQGFMDNREAGDNRPAARSNRSPLSGEIGFLSDFSLPISQGLSASPAVRDQLDTDASIASLKRAAEGLPESPPPGPASEEEDNLSLQTPPFCTPSPSPFKPPKGSTGSPQSALRESPTSAKAVNVGRGTPPLAPKATKGAASQRRTSGGASSLIASLSYMMGRGPEQASVGTRSDAEVESSSVPRTSVGSFAFSPQRANPNWALEAAAQLPSDEGGRPLSASKGRNSGSMRRESSSSFRRRSTGTMLPSPSRGSFREPEQKNASSAASFPAVGSGISRHLSNPTFSPKTPPKQSFLSRAWKAVKSLSPISFQKSEKPKTSPPATAQGPVDTNPISQNKPEAANSTLDNSTPRARYTVTVQDWPSAEEDGLSRKSDVDRSSGERAIFRARRVAEYVEASLAATTTWVAEEGPPRDPPDPELEATAGEPVEEGGSPSWRSQAPAFTGGSPSAASIRSPQQSLEVPVEAEESLPGLETPEAPAVRPAIENPRWLGVSPAKIRKRVSFKPDPVDDRKPSEGGSPGTRYPAGNPARLLWPSEQSSTDGFEFEDGPRKYGGNLSLESHSESSLRRQLKDLAPTKLDFPPKFESGRVDEIQPDFDSQLESSAPRPRQHALSPITPDLSEDLVVDLRAWNRGPSAAESPFRTPPRKPNAPRRVLRSPEEPLNSGDLGLIVMEDQGNKYEGQVGPSGLEGLGVLHFESGGSYAGMWARSAYEGSGIETFSDGSHYVGQFHGGKAHGSGVCYYADGATYAGQWSEGVQQGLGNQASEKGGSFSYVGAYVGGRRHGLGVAVFGSGDEFSGELQRDAPHGYGIAHLSGRKGTYEGQWLNGMRHGWAVSTLLNGSMWAGQWVYGRACWLGQLRKLETGELEDRFLEAMDLCEEAARLSRAAGTAAHAQAKVVQIPGGSIQVSVHKATKEGVAALRDAHLQRQKAQLSCGEPADSA